MTYYDQENQFLRQRLQKEIPILTALIQNLYQELDRKFHLNGAKIPVTFGFETDSLGSYTRQSAHEKEHFHFSLLFVAYGVNNPLSKEDRIDLFKHEYAHYMQYNMRIPEKYKWQAGTHGSAWKYCCSLIGAAPTPYYKAGEALLDHNYDKVLKSRIHDKTVPIRDTYQRQQKAQKQKDEVVVNRKFLEVMHWKENPIGRQVRNNDEILGTIVGVTEDFRSSNPIFVPEEPVVFQYRSDFGGCIQVKLKEPFDENLKKLNEDVKNIWPDGDLNFVSETRATELQISTVVDFRSVALMATITILFVTLMGLIGYINDEMQRRSKEIAIRKVNGAEASSILLLLSKDIFWTSMPAVCIGTLGAWYLGALWTDQFSETAEFPIYYYILIAFVSLLFIIGCVVIKTWRIANDNPVNSIKSE